MGMKRPLSVPETTPNRYPHAAGVTRDSGRLCSKTRQKIDGPGPTTTEHRGRGRSEGTTQGDVVVMYFAQKLVRHNQKNKIKRINVSLMILSQSAPGTLVIFLIKVWSTPFGRFDPSPSNVHNLSMPLS